MKTSITSNKAAKAIGPYVHGTATETMVFTSGQLGICPETGTLLEGVEAQTKQALENLKAVLEAAGSSFEQVLKTTIFLKSMGDFPLVNEIYASYFSENPPARSCVTVAELPKGGLVEIEAIALR